MKKIIATVLLLMFLGLEVQAATFKTAIAKYKAGNYTGCINDLDDIITKTGSSNENKNSVETLIKIASKYDFEKWKAGNPKDEAERKKAQNEIKKEIPKGITIDKCAYLLYYYALCLHQLGYKNEAKRFYKAAQTFTWESKSQIYSYSSQAINCIDKPESCNSSDMDDFIRSGKQVSDDIIKEELRRNLEKHRNEINRGQDLSFVTPVTDRLAWVDTGISPDIADQFSEKTTKVNNNEMPTDEEIGRAVRTLQKAGINPMNYMGGNNSEYVQLNSMLNDGTYGYPNDYDYSSMMMMMNGQNKKIPPQMMQTIMQQQMMGGFGF